MDDSFLGGYAESCGFGRFTEEILRTCFSEE